MTDQQMEVKKYAKSMSPDFLKFSKVPASILLTLK